MGGRNWCMLLYAIACYKTEPSSRMTCHSSNMDLSKLFMDLSKLSHVSLPFTQQNQVEVRWLPQSSSKTQCRGFVVPLAMFRRSTLCLSPFVIWDLILLDYLRASVKQWWLWCQEEVKGKQMRGIFQLQQQLAHYEDHIDGVDNPGHMQAHNNAIVL